MNKAQEILNRAMTIIPEGFVKGQRPPRIANTNIEHGFRVSRDEHGNVLRIMAVEDWEELIAYIERGESDTPETAR